MQKQKQGKLKEITPKDQADECNKPIPSHLTIWLISGVSIFIILNKSLYMSLKRSVEIRDYSINLWEPFKTL